MTNTNSGHREIMTERGEAGLGHPDYPIYQTYQVVAPTHTTERMSINPDAHANLSTEAQKQLGYITVKGMFDE